LECSAAIRARPWSLYQLPTLLRHGARVNFEIHISSLKIMPNRLTMHCCPTHGPSNARWPAAVSLSLHFYPIGASRAGSLSLPLLTGSTSEVRACSSHAEQHCPSPFASGPPFPCVWDTPQVAFAALNLEPQAGQPYCCPRLRSRTPVYSGRYICAAAKPFLGRRSKKHLSGMTLGAALLAQSHESPAAINLTDCLI
jgi:hypothetical protein